MGVRVERVDERRQWVETEKKIGSIFNSRGWRFSLDFYLMHVKILRNLLSYYSSRYDSGVSH